MPVSTISRRNFLASFAAVAAVPRSLWAQNAPTLPAVVVEGRATGATAKITTQTLRGGVSVLMGSGGNIAVLPGKDGKVLVDAGYSTSQPQITAALAALGADPLRLLIDTHWHFDHTDGNEWVHAAGAEILATARTRDRLSTPQTIAAFHADFPAAPAGAIPGKIFTGKHEVKRNGEILMLTQYEPAHTDTDTSVLFSHANVMHLGDTWFNGFYPFIDYSSGGSIDGMIRAADRNLATASASTILVPGHGPIGDKAQLTEFRAMLVGVRAQVAEQKKQGKSLADTVAARPSADFDAKFGGGFMKPEVFVSLVYQGV